MIISTALKWVGYLEHQTDDLLGVYNANPGKGGYTIFAQIIASHYRWRVYFGLPWCVVFVYAVFIEACGKETSRTILGKPQAGVKTLARRMKRRGLFKPSIHYPNPGDLIFCHSEGAIGHCGIVISVDNEIVTSVEGNTIDPSGHFEKHQGGAVAIRNRKLTDNIIAGYGDLQKFKMDLCS